MPDPDVLDPPSPARTRRVTCEFCECVLSPEGEVLKRGARAKAMMELADQVETLTATLAVRDQTIADLTAQLDTATRPPAPGPSLSPWYRRNLTE